MPRTLLLADDSITMQKVVGIIFAHEDFSVVVVGNGDDAIAKARELRPDIVVADVVMPGRTGYDVCEALKSDPATKDIPVLLLAGTFEPYDEARAQAVGANGHITKPFDSASFVQKVNELAGPAAVSAVPLERKEIEDAAPRQEAPSIPMAPGIQPLPPLSKAIEDGPPPPAASRPQEMPAFSAASSGGEPWSQPAATPGPITIPGGLPQATLTPGPLAAGFVLRQEQAGAAPPTPAAGAGSFVAKTPGPSSLGGGYSSPFAMPSSLVSPLEVKTPGPPDAVVSWGTAVEAEEDDWAEDIPDIDISAGPTGLPLSDGPQHDDPVVEELEELLPEDALEAADDRAWPMSADGPIQDEISPTEPTPVEGYFVGGSFEAPSERDADPVEEATPLESPSSVFGGIRSEEEEADGLFAFGEDVEFTAGPAAEPTLEEEIPNAEVTPAEAFYVADPLPAPEALPVGEGVPVAEVITAAEGELLSEAFPFASAAPPKERVPVAEAVPLTESGLFAEAIPAAATPPAVEAVPVVEAVPLTEGGLLSEALPAAATPPATEAILVAEAVPLDPGSGTAAAIAGMSRELVERIGWEVVPQVAELVLREQIQAASRELIEKVVWEVVPQLAETIIRQEVERMIREGGIPGMERVS